MLLYLVAFEWLKAASFRQESSSTIDVFDAAIARSRLRHDAMPINC